MFLKTLLFRIVPLVTCGLLVVFVVGGAGGWWTRLLAWQVDGRAAIRFFEREPLSFLVTERIVTQVVVEKREGSLLLGHKDGFLVGTVELLYGVDLAQLDPTSVVAAADALHVVVPPPTLLRTVPDLDSVRFIQKRSPMIAIADRLTGDNFYRRCVLELDDAALRFVETNAGRTTREQLVGRLNEYAPVIAGKIGTRLVFE